MMRNEKDEEKKEVVVVEEEEDKEGGKQKDTQITGKDPHLVMSGCVFPLIVNEGLEAGHKKTYIVLTQQKRKQKIYTTI